MTEPPLSPCYEDEIDLRELLQTLLAGWKVILVLMLLAAALGYGISLRQTPIYEASVSLAIDQSATPLKTTPSVWLLSDDMKEAVADELGCPPDALPSLSVTQDRSDSTHLTLTVQASDPALAADAANAWAEAGIAYFSRQVTSEDALEAARRAFTEADRALLDYLKENHLSALTWGDLAWLTGVGGALASPSQETELPVLSSQQRLDLADLMQTRLAAETAYLGLEDEFSKVQYALSLNPPRILSRAAMPSAPSKPKTLQNTLLAALLGGMLGVMWVLAENWWRKS